MIVKTRAGAGKDPGKYKERLKERKEEMKKYRAQPPEKNGGKIFSKVIDKLQNVLYYIDRG